MTWKKTKTKTIITYFTVFWILQKAPEVSLNK